MLQKACIQTPLGFATLTGDNEGILELCLHENGTVTPNIPTELQQAALQLAEYFNGARTAFDLKLNPKGTVFQQKVWTELQKIPFGQTISYLELAKKLGDPKVIRAAASANGKNPLWIVVPCHRVIGSNGSLTGYSGGLWRKKWLLEHENPSQQQVLF